MTWHVSGRLRDEERGTTRVLDRAVGCGAALVILGLGWAAGTAAIAIAGGELVLLLVASIGLPIAIWGFAELMRRTELSIDDGSRQLLVERRGLTGRRSARWPFERVQGVHVRLHGRLSNASGGGAVIHRWRIVVSFGDEELELDEAEASFERGTALALAEKLALRFGAPFRDAVEHEPA